MNEEQHKKIYDEMESIMTERDDYNRYTNGHLTLEDVLNIIIITFYGNKKNCPIYLENIVEEIWNRIIKQMKDEIMMSNLEGIFDNINLNDSSLSNLLSNLNLHG
tara:strand:- start:29 stop:343 length:315 start_codon:yes stop_codon:yes gene_type:complete